MRGKPGVEATIGWQTHIQTSRATSSRLVPSWDTDPLDACLRLARALCGAPSRPARDGSTSRAAGAAAPEQAAAEPQGACRSVCAAATSRRTQRGKIHLSSASHHRAHHCGSSPPNTQARQRTSTWCSSARFRAHTPPQCKPSLPMRQPFSCCQ